MTYQFHVFCCTNQRPEGHPDGCCANGGAIELRNYMKAKVKAEGIPGTRINASGCLDQCSAGPIMVVYPEGVWYRYQTKADIDEIINSHLKQGVIVKALLYKPE